MKSRIAVAILLIPLVVLATWKGGYGVGQWLFAPMVAAAFTLAVLELYSMLRPQAPYVPAGMVAVALAPILAWVAYEPGMIAGMLVVLPLTMIFARLSVDRRDPATAIAATLMGVLYVAPAAGLGVIVHASPQGDRFILLMLAAVWINDSAAYFGGRAFGRHKLAPRLSPNKSIEGFAFGVAACVVVVWFGNLMFEQPLVSQTESLLWGVALGVAVPFGDLFESMLKRASGVKDSGRLLGEHGGMLDRIDALLVAMPVTYLSLFVVGAL